MVTYFFPPIIKSNVTVWPRGSKKALYLSRPPIYEVYMFFFNICVICVSVCVCGFLNNVFHPCHFREKQKNNNNLLCLVETESTTTSTHPSPKNLYPYPFVFTSFYLSSVRYKISFLKSKMGYNNDFPCLGSHWCSLYAVRGSYPPPIWDQRGPPFTCDDEYPLMFRSASWATTPAVPCINNSWYLLIWIIAFYLGSHEIALKWCRVWRNHRRVLNCCLCGRFYLWINTKFMKCWHKIWGGIKQGAYKR